MSRLWMKWAALGAVGALGLAPIAASAWDTANTTTRAVLIQTEDTSCSNGTAGAGDDYGADTFSGRFCLGIGVTAGRGPLPPGAAPCCTNAGSNAFCTGAGTSLGGAAPCCTGAGTGTCTEAGAGTCDADNVMPPNFAAAAPGCTVYAASGGASFADTTGTAGGSADYYGILTNTGGTTWTLAVPQPVYAQVIGTTLAQSGAALIQNAQCAAASTPHPCCTGAGTGTCDVVPLLATVDTGTGAVGAVTAAPSPPAPPATTMYFSANGLFPGVPIRITGEANAADAVYFGSSWFNTDPVGPLAGGAFPSQCLGAGVPAVCCDGFLTDVPTNCPAATATGVPLSLSCAAAVTLPGNFAVFGPGVPLLAPGVSPPIDAALCDPPGSTLGDPAGTNFLPQPGQTQSGTTTYITAFTISRVYAPTFGANATTPAFAAQDVRVLDTPDWDGDLVPDLFDDSDGDTVVDATDNCRDVSNSGQADIGGVGVGSAPDGIGDACQCGDVNNDGRVTSGDATIMQRALLSPPTQCGATTGAGDCAGGFKCDVNNSNTCTSGDVTIIKRALLIPPTAAINPGCGPGAIAP